MAPLAIAYSGPPKFTIVRAFTEWRVDVPTLVLILLVLAWYLVSVRKVRQAGGQWAGARTFSFIVLGLGLWAIATLAWPGVYESYLFYARATQTVLLVLAAPLFLAMGKPLTLLIEAYPRIGRPVGKAIRSRVARVVTFPAVTSLALVAVPMSMYFTTWYTHFFSSGALRELTYLILMVPGFVFFWTLLRVDPVPKEYPYGVMMWLTAAEVIGDAFFGIAVMGDQTMIAGAHYLAMGYPYGPGLSAAQVTGGGIIWALGDSVGLPFLGIQFIQMLRADTEEAAEIDAELDARDAARAAARAARASQASSTAAGAGQPPADADAAHVAVSAAPDADDADDEDRPWWETDPRITNRFKRA